MRALPPLLLTLLFSGCAGVAPPGPVAAPIADSGLEEISIVALGME